MEPVDPASSPAGDVAPADGETPWLDDEEMAAWLGLARLVSRLPAELDRQLQRDAGLSHFEYQVMAGLSQSPEHTLRMSRLAEFAEGQLPRLSQVVARLEKRGWVTRRSDPSDGRSTLATLTDAGMAKVVATAPGHVATVRSFVFDPLTRAQVRQLRDICRRVGARLGDTC
nr:MarR family transcriptional regulator [Propionicimonas sp.]